MATAYTSDRKIGALESASTPLAAANELVINQNGDTLKTPLSAIEAKVFDAKTAVTTPAGTEVVVVRQTDNNLRQVALADIVPALNITDAKVSASAAIVDTKLATIATAGKVANSATTATNANTANAIVARDASGNFSAGTITATLAGSATGNAGTATTLQTARTIAISGDVTGTATSFNGSANISIAAAITADTVVNADINSAAAIAHTKLANITAGSVLMGNASNAPTATALSGDVTVNSSGVTAIGSGVIVDADVNASAAIGLSKLATGALPTGITVATANLVDANVTTAKLSDSGVVAGTYNNNAAQVRPFTVDAKGRVTSVGTAVDIALNYSAIAGSTYKVARLATTANLTATYANGTSGVGATLTNSGTLGALSLDGVAVAASDRILVKDQTSAFQNGIYTVTNTGSAVAAWVLTRVTDADTNAEIGSCVVTVSSGTANGGRVYATTFKATDTVGTTAMPWFLLLSGGPSVVTTTMLADGVVTEAKIDPNAKIRGATGGGTDRVFYENDQTVNTNYTINTNKNAMSAGPITVANGITVTVPNGSTWTIV